VALEAIEVRQYRPSEDKAFVYSTWLRNYKHSSYFAKRIKPVVFFAGHHAILDHLSRKASFKVFVACHRDDPTQILGYLACEPDGEKPTVHFVFVKEAFRKMGIARRLFTKAGINIDACHFTHWTLPVDEFIRRWPGMTHDPYRL
jgi:GNAT superfamily N-acetyltransferase